MLPTGTVTFLFTDIQDSTALWEREPEKMEEPLQIHNAAMRQAIEANGGAVFKTVGDAFQADFSTAPQALKTAIEGQGALQTAPWNKLGLLAVRMSLLAMQIFGFTAPPSHKRMLVITEADGCLVDGIEVVTGVSVGHRTLHVEDYGKVAAVFTDIFTGQSLRLAPHLDVRSRAKTYAPDETRHYFAQLKAYQIMPDNELLSVREVILTPSTEVILSRPGVRVACDSCGEEIINKREIYLNVRPLCRFCAGQGAYYQPAKGEETGDGCSKELQHTPQAMNRGIGGSAKKVAWCLANSK
jgi:formylmethanofuran dehydrogenase subunit E